MKNKLSTPSDLPQKACSAIVEHLNPLVADAFALYVKTKSFHWHLTGPHFRDYHLLFDEQAEQIFNTIDTIAERSRKLGGATVTSISHIAKLSHIKDENRSQIEAEEMLKILLKDNELMLKRMRQAHDNASKLNDSATSSILEVFIDETERRIWFLSATSTH
jgi:starvation-inducible DNA-binding protein